VLPAYGPLEQRVQPASGLAVRAEERLVLGQHRLAQVGYDRCSRPSDLAAAPSEVGAHWVVRSVAVDELEAGWPWARRPLPLRQLLPLLARSVEPAWPQAERRMVAALVSGAAAFQAEAWGSTVLRRQPVRPVSVVSAYRPMSQQCPCQLAFETPAARRVVSLPALGARPEGLHRLRAEQPFSRFLVGRTVIA